MIIQTERLALRELLPTDFPTLLAYQRDPRYLRYYRDSWANRSDDDVRAFLQTQIENQQVEPRRSFQLAITLRGADEIIGNCGVRRKADNEWEADIGYELAPEHWACGYATEAARALVDFGFRNLRLHRISAVCVAENLGSRRVLEKAGLRLEGRLRESEHFQGRWWDTLVYAVLIDEWRSTRE